MTIWTSLGTCEDMFSYVFIITKGMMVKKVLEDVDSVQVVRQFMDMQKPALTTVLF